MKQHKVTFLPDNKSGVFQEGTTLRDAALELGLVIESSCGGLGTCGECRVIVKEGLSRPGSSDELYLSQEELEAGFRLSCQTLISEDVTCLVPEESQTFDLRIMTEGKAGGFPLNPGLKKVYLELPEPEIGDNYFDFEVFTRELAKKGFPVEEFDFNVLKEIPGVLRSSRFKVTAVLDHTRLLAIEAGDTAQSLYGVAVDIGTTTVVAKLLNITTGQVCAVSSALNAQQPFGADVISRTNYIISRKGALEELQNLIAGQINSLIEELCGEAGITKDSIYKVSVVGNTIMRHIFLGITPENIAMSPYVPSVKRALNLAARELRLDINKGGMVYLLPDLGSYAGSDITGVLTVLNLECEDRLRLVVDIGTNGEIVLGSKKEMLSSSSPAGPAWEGASITHGMRASRGAIERAEIQDGKLKIVTIGSEKPVGICGSGLHDLVVEFLRAGLIDQSGRILDRAALPEELSPELKSMIIPGGNGINDIKLTEEGVLLTQKDIREVQLAKAAISAGITILMKELNVTSDDIDEILVAGAFGNHLKGKDAVELGLLPRVEPEKVRFIGNAALSGAEAVLISEDARLKAEKLSERVKYVEISGREDFQDIFVNSMFFSL
ncbi:MAG TPA: ASKHA domain-containing protein [Ignavibacteriales bacterium]|nr:ASKHA domain-containing protein [Ignavibacteriales bacterium]